MEEISKLWKEHPYVIMGVVAVVLIYFLWPSSSSSSSAPIDNSAAAIAAAAQVAASNYAAQQALAQTDSTNSAAVQAAQIGASATVAGYQAQLAAAQSGNAAANYQAYAGAYGGTVASLGSSSAALGIGQMQANSAAEIAAINGGNNQALAMLLGATSMTGLSGAGGGVGSGGAAGASNLAGLAGLNLSAPANANIVSEISQAVLGRPLAPAGQTYWDTAAQSQTTGQILQDFMSSPEALAKAATPTTQSITIGNPNAYNPNTGSSTLNTLATTIGSWKPPASS